MIADKAHGQLLANGWRWQDATSYHRDARGLSLSLEPQARVRDDDPTEERLLKLRTGRWVLRCGGTPVAVFDTLIPATVSVIIAAAYPS